MSRTTIHGYQLEITVVCCWDLRDSSTTFHDQDPYVRLDYAYFNFKTQVCRRQSKEPTFNQKFKFSTFEGCQEIGVAVWNKNTIEKDYLIGRTSVPLATVLLNGFQEAWWPLQYENRPAGQIKLVMNKLTDQRNVLAYNRPVPVDLHSPREAAVPYMAYPPSAYPITSQPLPSSIPQHVPIESRSVAYAIAQPAPPPTRPKPTLLVSSTRESSPFSPSAPSAPAESFSFDPPTTPPSISLPSFHTIPSTDLQNHPAPVSPSPYASARYQEERIPNREVPAVEEEQRQTTEMEPTKASLDQHLVQTTPPSPSRSHISAEGVRQRNRNPKNTITAEESNSTAATNRRSSKASPSLSAKGRLWVFLSCLLIMLYLKVGCPFSNLFSVGL